jgi:starch synthase
MVMNITYTITAYPPSTGGAQLYLHMLIIHLLKKHSPHVIGFWDRNRTDWLLGTTLRTPTKSKDYHIDGVPVHLLSFRNSDKLKMIPYVAAYYTNIKFASHHIASIIKPQLEPFVSKADLVHNVRIGREPLSVASFECAKDQDIPFVLTPVHHPRWKGWLYQTYHWLYQQSDAIITLTSAEKAYLAKSGVREEKIHVTGMGPILSQDANADAFTSMIEAKGPIVLFLGQHYLYKGFVQLLMSTAQVWKKFPETHFVFIGPRVQNSEDYFRNHPDPRIHRLGHVDLQVKTNALAACTLLCVPSSQESFGSVYTEAWAFSKPVIGCRIPAVSEVIDDGVNGYLVDQNPNEIADRIISLLQDESKAFQMGQAGKLKMQQRYSWEILSKLTEQVYQTVLR